MNCKDCLHFKTCLSHEIPPSNCSNFLKREGMEIIGSVSAWNLEDLLRSTLSNLKKAKTKYQINNQITRFLGRLPNCNLQEIKQILDKPEFCND